jgi:hypothetical protein
MVHSLLVLRTLVLIPLTHFEKKRCFRQKFETVLPVGDFFAKKEEDGSQCGIVHSWAIALPKKTHVYIILQEK